MRKLILVGLIACAGKAPPSPPNNNPDASGPPPDSGSTALTISGKTMDYFGGVAMPATAVATDGIDPQINTTSAGDATYSIDVQVGSKLFLVATLTNYRPTRSAAISVVDMPVMQDVYAMSVQDVKNQYTVLGKVPTTGTAFVAAELR